MTQTIEQLTARVRELEEENARLRDAVRQQESQVLREQTTSLDIYQAGYMACLNSLEYAATLQDNGKEKVAYFLPEGVAK